VKEADNRILRDERYALMRRSPLPWASIENVDPLSVVVTGWSPLEAEARYLSRLDALWSAP
jgi:hypothetical protein